MAGSSLTLDTHEIPSPSVGRLVFDAVADDGDGSFPTLVLPEFDGRILAITTNPGATAPTDNYDVTLVNADGFDILGGAGLNRDTANTERAAVTDGYVSRQEVTTLTIANNSVNDALAQVVIHYTQHV